MGSARLDGPGAIRGVPATVKIVVAGGFGVGKTTMVASISEIRALQTEALMTAAGVGVDDTTAVRSKTTTTVMMDFGRIMLDSGLIVYLFGTPGQDRFWFLWDELALGALGAVVMADTRRLADCFASVDYFERRGTPFVVAVNCFDGIQHHRLEAVRGALDIKPTVPVMLCDARDRASSKAVLVSLVEHVIAHRFRPG